MPTRNPPRTLPLGVRARAWLAEAEGLTPAQRADAEDLLAAIVAHDVLDVRAALRARDCRVGRNLSGAPKGLILDVLFRARAPDRPILATAVESRVFRLRAETAARARAARRVEARASASRREKARAAEEAAFERRKSVIHLLVASRPRPLSAAEKEFWTWACAEHAIRVET